MNVSTLTAFLAPFLPFLLKGTQEAAKEVGKQFGGDAWKKAKAIWSKLRPKVEAKPTAKEAVEDVANNPEDEDFQAALRVQLKKILAADRDLAAELAEIVGEDKEDSMGGDVKVNVVGNKNKTQTFRDIKGGDVDIKM